MTPSRGAGASDTEAMTDHSGQDPAKISTGPNPNSDNDNDNTSPTSAQEHRDAEARRDLLPGSGAYLNLKDIMSNGNSAPVTECGERVVKILEEDVEGLWPSSPAPPDHATEGVVDVQSPEPTPAVTEDASGPDVEVIEEGATNVSAAQAEDRDSSPADKKVKATPKPKPKPKAAAKSKPGPKRKAKPSSEEEVEEMEVIEKKPTKRKKVTKATKKVAKDEIDADLAAAIKDICSDDDAAEVKATPVKRKRATRISKKAVKEVEEDALSAVEEVDDTLGEMDSRKGIVKNQVKPEQSDDTQLAVEDQAPSPTKKPRKGKKALTKAEVANSEEEEELAPKKGRKVLAKTEVANSEGEEELSDAPKPLNDRKGGQKAGSGKTGNATQKPGGPRNNPWTAAERLQLFEAIVTHTIKSKELETALPNRTAHHCRMQWGDWVEKFLVNYIKEWSNPGKAASSSNGRNTYWTADERIALLKHVVQFSLTGMDHAVLGRSAHKATGTWKDTVYPKLKKALSESGGRA